MISFGEALRLLRKHRGFTFRKLSELSGLSIGYLSDMENGRKVPSIKNPLLERLSIILGVGPTMLKDIAEMGKIKIKQRRLNNHIADFEKRLTHQACDKELQSNQ